MECLEPNQPSTFTSFTSMRELEVYTVPLQATRENCTLLVELLCAHAFVLVDQQAIAARTPAVRCHSGTKTPNRRY